MEEMIALINQSGFPIIVSLFCLIRMETTIKNNTVAINKLAAKIGGDIVE